MGAVTTTYRASATLTVTGGLQTLAASGTWLEGWYSDVLNNTSNLDLDTTISGLFTKAVTAGEIRVYAFAQCFDATYRNGFGSANTPGAAAQVTSTGMTAEKRDAAMVLLWSTAFASAASTLEMPDTSLRGAFGGFLPPMVNLYVTISGAALTAAVLYAKGYAENVA